MVVAIAARTGAASVVERKTAVHIDITGLEPTTTGGGSGTITANTLANPTVVTSTAHGLASGDTILIAGSNSTPTINGNRVVTFISANTFSIPVNVTVAGTAGTWTFVSDAQGRAFGAERRYYILVDAPVGTDDGRSHVFAPSADGKHSWDGYIFPEDGAYTLRVRDAADNTDVATQAVTVTT
jgi:hypothetical protein